MTVAAFLGSTDHHLMVKTRRGRGVVLRSEGKGLGGSVDNLPFAKESVKMAFSIQIVSRIFLLVFRLVSKQRINSAQSKKYGNLLETGENANKQCFMGKKMTITRFCNKYF